MVTNSEYVESFVMVDCSEGERERERERNEPRQPEYLFLNKLQSSFDLQR